MEVVDGQILIWTAHSPEFPWEDPDFGSSQTSGVEARIRAQWTDTATTPEVAIEQMDEAGVDAAVLSMPYFYGFRYDYAIEAARRYPHKFASMPRIDPTPDDIENHVRVLRTQPGVLGARIVILNDAAAAAVEAGAYDRFWAAAEREDIPLMVFCTHHIPAVHAVGRKHPDLQLIIDHFGVPQPPLMDPDPEPWGALRQLVAMAELPRVAVKFSGAPTLSSEGFPFADLWPHLHRVVAAFGPERLMWASDFQRVTNHTYAEALAYLRDTGELSANDKEWILGRTLRTLLRWEREDL